jgi:hypothetical protein
MLSMRGNLWAMHGLGRLGRAEESTLIAATSMIKLRLQIRGSALRPTARHGSPTAMEIAAVKFKQIPQPPRQCRIGETWHWPIWKLGKWHQSKPIVTNRSATKLGYY